MGVRPAPSAIAPKVEEAPKAEAKPEPSPAAPAAEQSADEVPTEREPEIFRPSTPSAGISFNVVGKIDLSAINDNTRPSKKSKTDKNRKRARVGKNPVDVKAEAAKAAELSAKTQGAKKPVQGPGAQGGRSADPNGRGANRPGQGARSQKLGR